MAGLAPQSGRPNEETCPSGGRCCGMSGQKGRSFGTVKPGAAACGEELQDAGVSAADKWPPR